MLLSQKTIVKLNQTSSNIVGHMCYAAYKLWNVCNYERLHHKDLNLPVVFPNWYYQKKAHKDDLWYKQLPSQTAQEVCKLLDKSWTSYFKLLKTQGVENPNPPRFKHEPIAITYMQNGIVHPIGEDIVRLSLPKRLKSFMSETYGVDANYLFLKNNIFKVIDTIKQLKIYPPENGCCKIIVIYEIPDVLPLPDNGKYLSIDIGIHNLMTCYNSSNGETFIVGRKYLAISRFYNKEIARIQSQWSSVQSKQGFLYPKSSKHIKQLYEKKNHTIHDYLHKTTRWIVNYCMDKGIHTVVIGDITNIRKEKDYGNITNQKLHGLPYKQIYDMLEYKLQRVGIRMVKQNEAYSSQTSPLKANVSKDTAEPEKRVYRGLFIDNGQKWNADCVGAYNILRLYLSINKTNGMINLSDIKTPYIAKVAV